MATLTATILAGGEFDSPPDSPSGRLDTAAEFPFVGALQVSNGASTYGGSAVAISQNWVITSAHNVDLDDDGFPDATWSGSLHLPNHEVHAVAEAYTHPDYTGFANPSVNDDIALLRLVTPLPENWVYPSLGSTDIGSIITLVGFGRSGYGDYGYTSNATLTDRRFGSNMIDGFSLDDEGSGVAEVFRYDFDDPSTTGEPDGSLGNELETIIGPGDSGGAALRWDGEEWVLVGINTFTEGFGGRFGDVGGGVLLEPYEDWIFQTTQVPEVSGILLAFMALPILLWSRWK